MHTTKLLKELRDTLKAVRVARTETMEALDALEDATHEAGPVRINGTRNEEMKQTLDGMRNDLETAIAALRRALATADQLEEVAHRYTDAGIAHPVVAPARPAPPPEGGPVAGAAPIP